MSENPSTSTEPTRLPPERDASVPPTPEQRKRHRRLVWLIVRLALVVLLIALIIWGMVSCVNALTSAANATSISDLPAAVLRI